MILRHSLFFTLKLGRMGVDTLNLGLAILFLHTHTDTKLMGTRSYLAMIFLSVLCLSNLLCISSEDQKT